MEKKWICQFCKRDFDDDGEYGVHLILEHGFFKSYNDEIGHIIKTQNPPDLLEVGEDIKISLN